MRRRAVPRRAGRATHSARPGFWRRSISVLCIQHSLMPGCLNVTAIDPSVPRTCARRQRGAPGTPGHQQLFRIRRQQLQPDRRRARVKPVFVLGIGIWGPGLLGWTKSLPVLQGRQDPAFEEAMPPPSALLSATERRRSGLSVRLALAVAQEASAMAGIPPGAVRSVFGTSNGDGPVVHAILETLAGPDRQVSPTQFHNSVHNAAAGYWSIGAGSQMPALCLGCHDATFAAALLKAAAEGQAEGSPVLLCVYDAPMPEPLAAGSPDRWRVRGGSRAQSAAKWRRSRSDQRALQGRACRGRCMGTARARSASARRRQSGRSRAAAVGSACPLRARCDAGRVAGRADRNRGGAVPVGTRIQDLIPHQGAMCLLDEVASWTPGGIVCRTRSHLGRR